MWLYKILLAFLHCICDLAYAVKSKITALKNIVNIMLEKRTQNLTQLTANFSHLTRHPQHTAVVVLEEDISYIDLSYIVFWCIALGVSFISVYDRKGIIKLNQKKLYNEIRARQEEAVGSSHIPHWDIKIHNSLQLQDNGCMNGYSKGPTIHLNLLSREDGRGDIVSAGRILCQAVASGHLNPGKIDQDLVQNSLISIKDMPDPDLLIIFGAVQSTVGFLPWQIRVTEIFSVPSHHNICFDDFFHILKRFTHCEQRYGK